ncbi:MAG TPA: DUF1365 domain-containing protein [Solirubrobacteraceae bacterium]
MTASCIYEGTIRHRRMQPRREFCHRLALFYLDLDELPELLGGRLLAPGPGLLRFRRRDYHGDADVPLADAVRDTIADRVGLRPAGPIRLLTQVRSWGHCFNPVSFYYCVSPDGRRVDAILTEVTNTPWGERHAYVLQPGAERSPVLDATVAKAMHVSPFLPMDLTYGARATTPGPTLSVHMESRRADAPVFDATLSMVRRELTGAATRKLALRYPLATVRLLALIYGRALGLKLAGARVHPHPSRARPGTGAA